MTVLTNIGALDVPGMLAGCSRSIMTADTVAGDATVVKSSRAPVARGMTVVALVAAGDVIWTLADRNGAIVAGEARAQYLGMIHAYHR